MPLGGVPPQLLGTHCSPRGEGDEGKKSQPPFEMMDICFFEAQAYDSVDGWLQSGNCCSQFISWQHSSTFLLFYYVK